MTLFKKKSFYIAILGIIFMLFIVRHFSSSPPRTPPIVEPAANPYKNAIAASGIIESLDQNIAIGVPQAGMVKTVDVVVWQNVKKGDRLFTIDDRELQANLIVQEANVEVAKAALERVRDQLSRLEAIKDPRAVSKEELNTRRGDVRVAEAQVLSSEALVKQTKMLLSRLIVKAPKDGTILQSNIRAGEYVSAVANNDAMILGNLNEYQVRADVDEQNASRVVPGLPATAYPKNNTTLAIPLKFERVEPFVRPKQSLTGAGNERVDTRVLQVIYRFVKPEGFTVYVGQQVDVFIDTNPQK